MKFSPKAARHFRISLIIAFFIGIIIGLIICGTIPDFRASAWFWVLMPLILGAFFPMLVLGFYLIFLNQKT